MNIDYSHFFLKNIFTITFIFGVFAYGFFFIHGFSFIDELCALFFFLIYIYYTFKHNILGKEFITTFSIITFFFIYSCINGLNTYKAALLDYVIISKPFLLFYVCYHLKFLLKEKYKRKLKYITVIISIACLFIGLSQNIFSFFGHPAQFATTINIAAILYLYCSNKTSKDVFNAFLILSIGLLSTRSKFYGFYVSYIFIFFMIKNISNKKLLNFKNILLIGILLTAIVLVAWKKIYDYTYTGGLNNENTSDMWARPALYVGMIKILEQYPLLGSGMGSYANYASGAYYSPIYYKLGYENIYGLTPEEPNFAADTFFPCLAQYGIIGIIFFTLFWKKRIKEAKLYFINTNYPNEACYKLCILIFIFFLIESLADSTFTQNRGMFMMGLLGLILKDGKINYFNNSINKKDDKNINRNSDI